MSEHIIMQIVEPDNGIVALENTDVMKHLFPEYFKEQKPDYEWNEEDNIVAYLQFDSFPEEIFRKFIEAQNLEIKKQRFYNPGDGRSPFLIGDDVIINKNDETEIGWEEDPHRVLWAGGLLLEKMQWNVENKESQTALIEILKSFEDSRVWLRISGGHEKLKKKVMTDIFYWFEQNNARYSSTRYFVCSCLKCRSKYFQERYAIQDKYILNLYENFIPKIQCYESGDMRRLDRLSNLTQPQIQVVILHHDDDEYYLKTFYFPKKGWDIEATVWSRADILAGASKEELLETKISEANVVIVFISPAFIMDENLWRKHLGKVVSRSRKKEMLFVPFQIRPCLWKDAFQGADENTIPNQITLARPEDKDLPTDKNWEVASSEIHFVIEKWLKNRLKSDFYITESTF